MIKRLVFSVIVLTGIVFSLEAQNENTAAASRFKNLKMLLDYRYKGGFYTFQKDFFETVTYPEEARKNCIIGIVIASFQVDCDGNYLPVKTRLKNPLHYGIDDEVSKFLLSTQGKWNTCHDKKFTRFEVPIQFTMEGTATNEEDAAIVLEGENPGYVCTADSVYYKRALKFLKKKKPKKAVKSIEILIQRNPYTVAYYDLLKQAVSSQKEQNKKKKK